MPVVLYRKKSPRAVQFRKWANGIVKDYTIKGWIMDDERLKRATYLTDKYFDEQPKSEEARRPVCPPEKEKAIREAFEYLGMI